MTLLETIGLEALAVAGMVGCGLFAGLETGVYRLNRVRLQLRKHEGWASAAFLDRMLHKPQVLITALLIGTNMATYLATSSMAHVLEGAGYKEWQIIIFDAMIVTPMLMIFAEVLPKDLFAAHTDRLVYPLAVVIRLTQFLLTITLLLPLVLWLTAVLSRGLGIRQSPMQFHPRSHIQDMMHEGLDKGILSSEQSELAARILDLSQRQLHEIMQPIEAGKAHAPSQPGLTEANSIVDALRFLKKHGSHDATVYRGKKPVGRINRRMLMMRLIG